MKSVKRSIACVMLMLPVFGFAAIYHVDCQSGDDTYEGEDIGSAEHPYKTIGKVFDLGSDVLRDGEIVVHRGTYHLNGTNLVKNLYVLLRGETGNPEDVVIDADGQSSCARFVGSEGNKKKIPFRIFGMTFTNGRNSSDYCGVAVEANVVLSNCVVRACGSETANAYPIYVNDATVVDCVVTNCHVQNAPSAVMIGSKGGTIDRCLLADDSSSSGIFGAIHAKSGGLVRDTVVSNCTAKIAAALSGVPDAIAGCTFVANTMTIDYQTRECGAIRIVATESETLPSTTVISNSDVICNSTVAQGAGITISERPALVVDCRIEGNTAARCAGINAVPPEAGEVILRRCTIQKNVAIYSDAGGAFLGNGVVAESCTIVSNTATSGAGGGVFGHGFILRKSVLRGNEARTGGGVCVVTNGVAAAQISDCSILDNASSYCGGGVSVGYTYGAGTSLTNGYVLMSGCLLSNNVCRCEGSRDTYGGGGGVSLLSAGKSAGRFERCVFSDNRSLGYGGAFSTRGEGSTVTDIPETTVRSCLFVRNTAKSNAGAMYLVQAGPLQVDNCTFSGNETEATSDPNDDTYVRWTGVKVRNCIFNTLRFDINSIYKTALQTNCLNAATLPKHILSTTGNFATDPGFVNATAGDWHLQRTSPCVGAGAYLDWMTGSSRDLDGHSRIGRGAELPCLGAYEFRQTCGLTLILR